MDDQIETGTVAGKPFCGLLKIFQPSPPAPVTLTDPKEIAEKYRLWQTRVLTFSIIGYATFYLVRKNLGFAKPMMEGQIGLDDQAFGLFLTLNGVLYGVSKFANGFLADRANARTFMVSALIVSALLNVAFGFSSGLVVLGVIWMLNGWVQGMGFPPCARLMANWFPPKQLATKFSIWNASHNIGSIVVAVLCSYLVVINWRLCFFVPAAIALGCAAVLWFNLPDTPPSVGLPEVEGTHVESSEAESPEQFKSFLMEKVFRNKYIWLVSFANFFVYTLRYAVFDWGPTILYKTKHIELIHASWMIGRIRSFRSDRCVARRLDYRPVPRRTRRARLRCLHGAGGRFGLSVLESSRALRVVDHRPALRHRLFRLRPAMSPRHRRREPRHQTRRRHRRWIDEHLWLCQHDAFGRGIGISGQALRMGHRIQGVAGLRCGRHASLRGRLAGKGPRLQRLSEDEKHPVISTAWTV